MERGAGAAVASPARDARPGPDASWASDAAPAPGAPPAPDAAPALGGSDPITGHGVRNLVAFTFDDGPNLAWTPRVLAALDRYDVPATFFVVGRRLRGPRGEAGRALLRRMVASGHLVGNHSFNHADLRVASAEERAHELDATNAAIARTLGRAPGAMRPPFGHTSQDVRADAARRGLTEVLWNLAVSDFTYDDPRRLCDVAVERIVASEGGIVVFHDRRETTARALPRILRRLEDANCRRLARGEEPILPVSLHYFLRDDGVPRPVPDAVEARTQRYRTALVVRCTSKPADRGRAREVVPTP